MNRVFSIKNDLAESRLFLRRLYVAIVAIALLTASLVARLVYLQIVGHEHYATLAKENSIKLTPVAPSRGIIFDRNGKILAENTPSYSLELIPEQIKDIDDTLSRLQQLFSLPKDKIEQFHKQRKREKRFNSIALISAMTEEELAKFAVSMPFFPGVEIKTHQVRHYPFYELTSHAIGYVGRINELEIKELPMPEYQGATHIGKLGIERTYEKQLHGTTGYAEIETNVQGRPLKTVSEVKPIPGANLYLSLDIDLQQTAFDALDFYSGAVVAIDIETGGILVFVSKPGFDPNPFVVGISGDAYRALNESENQPLYNRALRGLYPPGSTIKPFIALAGLEYDKIQAGQSLYCPGYYTLPGVSHRYRDWRKGGHGSVGMIRAITESCDVYFYRLAQMLGIQRMHDFLQQFGFGEKTGIDMFGETAGLLPSPAWKNAKRKQRWFEGETLISGIGQGYHQVTPLQLARATATLANRGQVVTPRMVDKIVTAQGVAKIPETKGPEIPLKAKNLEPIFAGMINVVHSGSGTAKRIGYGIPYQIAGKTGTAQVFGIKQNAKYNEREIDFKLRDNALFVAFAPAQAPKIAIAVVVEHGGHGGSVAAPIAAKVIKKYLKDLQ